MTDIRANEREFMSQVVSWLNEFIREGSYPFGGASSESSLEMATKKTKFPDIQIWVSREAKESFCICELKTPATPIDDYSLLSDAAEKAQAEGVNYFVVWNMREAALWRTPQPTDELTEIYKQKDYEPLLQVLTPSDLWVPATQTLLKSKAREILDDLATIHRKGHLNQVDVDSIFFVKKLHEAVASLYPFTLDVLVSEVGKSSRFRNGLFDWAVKQGIAAYEAGAPFYESVSRQIVYRLIGRVLFYLTLRRFRSDIPKLDIEGVAPEEISERLKDYFRRAREIDYQAVFEDDFPDTAPFPAKGAPALKKLINDLNRYNFSYMPQDVIGNVFEKLIPSDERHTLGQYFTNENLVDLILALCIRSKDDAVLDPTCGTGTFLIRAYDRLKMLGEREHRNLIPKIWGVDIAHFPAELATINLYKQRIEDYASFPRIITRDFFDVKAQDSFKFPPPRPSADPNYAIEEKMPLFDAIVGNFPYIRQELIEKRIKGYKDKLKNVLFAEWRENYRELFDNGGLKLSGQADIYAYLFFHAATHLKEGGRLGIVTSNSWLDVSYGYELQNFFLKNFKLIAVIESRCEPWFQDAAVNTVVTVLERCKDKEKIKEHKVKFVKLKKWLKDLIPWSPKNPMDRWFGLDKLAHTIERASDESFRNRFISPRKNREKEIGGPIAAYEDENFKINTINQGELLDQLEKTKKTGKWGKLLRAPDIYFEITKECEKKLIALSEKADVRFGIKTGINKFFHLTPEKIKLWQIEKEFLRPLITSPKEIESLYIDPQNIEYKVFYCNLSKNMLRRKGKKGALKYISWGEKQKTVKRKGHKKGGVSFPEVPSVQGRKLWYALEERKPSHFAINRFINERFYFPINKHKTLIGDVAFEGTFRSKKDAHLYTALLNCTLTFLGVEILGRLNLGEGLLTFYGPDIAELLIPDADAISKADKAKILKAFDKLLEREVKPIFDELQMKDRQAFDKAVFAALGLDPQKHLKPLYDGLIELVNERIELAKQRKKIKNNFVQKSIEKLKEQVIDEVLPNGLKQFPDAFIDSRCLKGAREIPVGNQPLKLGNYFMGQQEVYADDGFKFTAASAEEAKFIIYSQQPNSNIIKIPNDKKAIIDAVVAYQKYLKELKEKLFEVFFARTLDHKQADMLIRQAFSELNIPNL